MMTLFTIIAQLVVATAVMGVVMTALGFGTPIHSKLLVLALTALPVGIAVWLAGRLLDRRANLGALCGAIAGGIVGYLLIETQTPQRLTQAYPSIDSFWWFTAAVSLPVTAGYWLFRRRRIRNRCGSTSE